MAALRLYNDSTVSKPFDITLWHGPTILYIYIFDFVFIFAFTRACYQAMLKKINS